MNGRQLALGVACAGAFGAFGCRQAVPPPLPGAGIEVPAGDALFNGKVCLSTEWLGFAPPNSGVKECPEASNWKAAPVRFNQEFAFCRYTAVSPAPERPGVPALAPTPETLPARSLRLERDCKIVASFAPPVALLDTDLPPKTDIPPKLYEDRIRWHLGCPESSAGGCGAYGRNQAERDAFLASDRESGLHAQLLVIDSHRPLMTGRSGGMDPNDRLARSMHGSSVVSAAMRSGLPKFHDAEVALPLVGDDTTRFLDIAGGQYGTLGDLAASLASFLDVWLPQSAAKNAPKLVINLSVGWSPEYGDQRQATQLIYQMVVRARCAGALVFAAAGNRFGKNQEPVYPAAWADRPLPKTDCAKAAGQPVVYAVGGLGMNEKVAGLTRARAIPELFAPGYTISYRGKEDRGSVSIPGGTGIVSLPAGEVGGTWLNGTSIGTAHVSGLATRIWQENASVSEKDLIGMLYLNGDPIDEVVTLGLGAKPKPRAIHVCRTLLELCNKHGCFHKNEITGWCKPFEKTGFALPKPPLNAEYEKLHDPPAKTGDAPPPGSGGGSSASGTGPSEPSVLPQPGQVHCSSCRPRPGSVLVSGILLQDGSGYSNIATRFTMWDYNGHYAIGEALITIGTEFKVQILGPDPLFDLTKFKGGFVEMFEPGGTKLISTDELLPPNF